MNTPPASVPGPGEPGYDKHTWTEQWWADHDGKSAACWMRMCTQLTGRGRRCASTRCACDCHSTPDHVNYRRTTP